MNNVEESRIKINETDFYIRQSLHKKNRNWLIVTHGIGEHSGRYDFMFELFSEDFNIFCYDLRGHGKSGGKKAYVNGFETYRNDLSYILKHLRNENDIEKFILFGHSMGGLITADFIQHYPEDLKEDNFYPSKVFLSSPAALPSGSLAKSISLIPNRLLDKGSKSKISFPIPSSFDLAYLSHNPKVGEDYINDQLIHKSYSSNLLLGLLSTAKRVFSKPLNLECPLSVVIGDDDKIVCPLSLKRHFKYHAPKVEWELKTFNEGRHELHNEIDEIRSPYFEFLKLKLKTV